MKTNAYTYAQVPVHTALIPHQCKELHCTALIKHTQEVIKINCCMLPIIPLVKHQGKLASKISFLFSAYYQYYNLGRLMCSSVNVISCNGALQQTKQSITEILFSFFEK